MDEVLAELSPETGCTNTGEMCYDKTNRPVNGQKDRRILSMKSAESFFNWAFRTRANSVLKLYNGEMVSPEKMF